VEAGEFVAIVGPSGCGKTTLLNIIAGLLTYDDGSVSIDGQTVRGPGINRAVVFQHASLLPWRTIAGNVRYGMELQKRFDAAAMRERTKRFITLVGLAGFERHYPSELSGGMQQREHMQLELLKIWSQARKTVIFITHQINEAIYLADRVAVMGPRPGTVKGVFAVPFDRPRPLALKRDPRFLEIEDAIWQMVEDQPQRLGIGAAEDTGTD
jgi:NitT/TauT family transport system ATP-binding protein